MIYYAHISLKGGKFMANKKAALSTKRSTTQKSTASKRPTATKVTTVKAVEASRFSTKGVSSRLPANIVNIVIAEVIGTFVLTLVALLSVSSLAPLYIGLTMLVLVVVIGAISGAHVNPAVTFGLWTARRLRSILLPFYWVAQFIGAMAAVVLLSAITNGAFGINFSDFWNLNWGILIIELVGTAVFLFGFMASTSQTGFSQGTKAIGIGLSLSVGLLVASSLFATLQGSIDQTKITSIKDVPHELRVKSAALNPAIALAATENTDSQLQGSNAMQDEKQTSRLGVEVILGTLIGAALGANLYLATSYRNKR